MLTREPTRELTQDTGNRAADTAARYTPDVERAPDARDARDSRSVREWPDAWLIEAVRGEPADAAALDALVARHWRALYGRCRMLAPSGDAARDLAQETWVRVLRARHRLDPTASFAAYLTTIATNLWRDRQRARRRAGPLADHRLASIDAAVPTGEGDAVSLADALPDAGAAQRDAQAELRLDIDRALERLSPRARDVLVARYLDGESAAEIGRRYGRTEQTITTWLRQASAEMRRLLGGEPTHDRARADA